MNFTGAADGSVYQGDFNIGYPITNGLRAPESDHDEQFDRICGNKSKDIRRIRRAARERSELDDNRTKLRDAYVSNSRTVAALAAVTSGQAPSRQEIGPGESPVLLVQKEAAEYSAKY